MTANPSKHGRARSAAARRATTAPSTPSATVQVELRALVNVGGEPFLGPGRVELLEAVRASGSLSAAARALGMSYRKSWALMDSVNRVAGVPLAELTTGGVGGGGARLTALGDRVLRAFRRLEADAAKLRCRAERRVAAALDPGGRRGAPPNGGRTRGIARAGRSGLKGDER